MRRIKIKAFFLILAYLIIEAAIADPGAETQEAAHAPSAPGMARGPLRLRTLDERLSYVEYLLERYPSVLRANLQFRRNLLDVLNHVHEVSETLGPNANPMESRPVSTMTLSYSPGSRIAYDPKKIAHLKEGLIEDLSRLPLDRVSSLQEDLVLLRERSQVNGAFSTEAFKVNLGRFIRVSPLIYEVEEVAKGRRRGYLSSQASAAWKSEATQYLHRLTEGELDQLYNDAFTQHQAKVISRAAEELKIGKAQEVLSAQKNQFIGKTVAQALKPTIVSATGDQAEVRYLRVSEVLTPDDVFVRCYGKDCSILSVPYFPQVKGTKTYSIGKSKNLAQPLDGYAFVAPVEVEGKRLPYIITVNGNLTSSDVKKIIQATGLDWGAKEYVYADFTQSPHLVNSEPMRIGLTSKGARRIRVKLPAGWDQVENYVNDHKVGQYSNYYAAKNLESAFIASIEPQGADFLRPIERTVRPAGQQKSSALIRSRPVLDRGILAAHALEGNTDPEVALQIRNRLGLEEKQISAATRLNEVIQHPGREIGSSLYEELQRELEFNFKNITELDLVTRANSLNRLYEEKPSIAEVDRWKSAYTRVLGEIERNWQLAGVEEKQMLYARFLKDFLRELPSQFHSFTPRFLAELNAFSTSGAAGASDAFLWLAKNGFVDSKEIAKRLPEVLDVQIRGTDDEFRDVQRILRVDREEWSVSEKTSLWESFCKRVGSSRTSSSSHDEVVLKSLDAFLDEVPSAHRGPEWLGAKWVKQNYYGKFEALQQFRVLHPWMDLSSREAEIVDGTIRDLNSSLSSALRAPIEVFKVVADPSYREKILKKVPLEELNKRLLAVADFSVYEPTRFPDRYTYLDRLGLFDAFWEKRAELPFLGEASRDFVDEKGILETLKNPEVSEATKTKLRESARTQLLRKLDTPILEWRNSEGELRHHWDRIFELRSPYLKELLSEGGDYERVFRSLDTALRGSVFKRMQKQTREHFIRDLGRVIEITESPDAARRIYQILERRGLMTEEISAKFSERVATDPKFAELPLSPSRPPSRWRECFGFFTRVLKHH